MSDVAPGNARVIDAEPLADARACWCGWYPLRPRHLFASHLTWHLDTVRRLHSIEEALSA